MSRRSAREVERRRSHNRSVRGGDEKEDAALAGSLQIAEVRIAHQHDADEEIARKLQEGEEAVEEEKGHRKEQEKIDLHRAMALSLESMDNNNSQQEEGKGDDMDLVHGINQFTKT